MRRSRKRITAALILCLLLLTGTALAASPGVDSGGAGILDRALEYGTPPTECCLRVRPYREAVKGPESRVRENAGNAESTYYIMADDAEPDETKEACRDIDPYIETDCERKRKELRSCGGSGGTDFCKADMTTWMND